MLIEDFERTENSDMLFGVIGRALIIATRFDSTCTSFADAIDYRHFGRMKSFITESEFNDLLKKAKKKHHNLGRSTTYLGLSGGLSDGLFKVLEEAREARNVVAHDICVGLEGSIDTKFNEDQLLSWISDSVTKLAWGNVVLSRLQAEFNDEEFLHEELIRSYVEKVRKWVMEK